MFDFAWSELALIGVVALVFIGPKDMPVAIKAVSDVVKKARKMASEFQSHVDDMVKDTELADVRKQISEIRNFDIKGTIERAIDDDGSLRRAFTEDPFKTPTPTYTPPTDTPSTPAAAPLDQDGDVATLVAEAPAHTDTDIATATALEASSAPAAYVTSEPETAREMEAPAFIPPSIAHAPVPPAFIPPGTRSPVS